MKRIVFLVLSLAVLALLASCGPLGGDVEDPGLARVYTIETAEDFAKIGSTGFPLRGKYELTSDLTLTNWMPIGAEQGSPFTGTFNGGAGRRFKAARFISTYGKKFKNCAKRINGITNR